MARGHRRVVVRADARGGGRCGAGEHSGGRLRRTASRSLITLILTALAFITIALRWATFPDANGGLDRVGQLGEFNLGDVSLGGAFTVTSGAGYGLYLGLIAAVAAAVASLVAFRAASNLID
jgi:hypothetical protein